MIKGNQVTNLFFTQEKFDLPGGQGLKGYRQPGNASISLGTNEECLEIVRL